jgi:hypothetical protein
MPKIDKKKALALRVNHNLSYREIGDMLGCTKQSVQQAIAPLLPTNPAIIPEFRSSINDVLSNAQMQMLDSFFALSKVEKKELLKRRGLVDFGILYDKEYGFKGSGGQNVVSLHVQIVQNASKNYHRDTILSDKNETLDADGTSD